MSNLSNMYSSASNMTPRASSVEFNKVDSHKPLKN